MQFPVMSIRGAARAEVGALDVNDTQNRRRRASPKPAPRPVGVRVRRSARRMLRPLRRFIKSIRSSRRGYKGVERPPRWRPARMKIAIARFVTYVGTIILAGIVARSVVIVIGGQPGRFPFGFNPDLGCRDISYSCGVANSILMTLLTLAFVTSAFVFVRLRRVRRPYVKRAKTETRALVQTAGTIIGEVVGRDEVCNVIMDDLRERTGRRPHVVLGGAGIGKTAVLFQLTRVLAENGAVPVPIRLRDAGGELNFMDMARKRFVSEIQGASISDSEGERVWRELCKDDQVVVLADGLEEALSDERARAKGLNGGDGAALDDDQERDNRIRNAVIEAKRNGIPLVIASRPHDALVGLDAAMVELEDLGEEAALEYIERGASTHDAHRLDWVIETAEVTETPLFLQIAHDLHEHGLLEHARYGQSADWLDTREGDRAALRVRLLETWMRALIDGHFHVELAIAPKRREATIEHLAALACMGLRDDTLEVPFALLLERLPGPGPEEEGPYRYAHVKELLDETVEAANQVELPGSHLRVDIEREIRLAATRGLQLGLVEPRSDGVRFPHSIVQAYLASRLIGRVIDDDDTYLPTALKKAGRELLAALTMFSRSAAPERDRLIRPICDALRGVPDRVGTAKKLDALVTALQIDCVDRRPQHQAIAAALVKAWPPAFEDRTVEEAKLKAIARFAEAAHTVSKSARPVASEPAYRELFEIGRMDLSYRVRLAAAQELGSAGDAAFRALADSAAPDGSYLDLPSDVAWRDENVQRDLAFRAWLAPMLVRSTVECQDEAKLNLASWLECVGSVENGRARDWPLSLEIALAQGFKHAANRCPEHPNAQVKARAHLAEQVIELLKIVHFWYTRITLVHALCLWALPEMPERENRRARRRARTQATGSAARQASGPQRRGTDPQALVRHWLRSSDHGTEHPFVDEAYKLAVMALEKREPERFMWIDESGVATKIGARPPRPDVARKHELWIAPSVGWSALHPRAQRLVADVLLMLNLIERDGRDPADHERRMRRALRDDLPPCLAKDRQYLEPSSTIGMVMQPSPGASCEDECPFDLCPYPPKGTQPYRVELSEAFCRRQRVLLGSWWRPFPRRTATWQGTTPKDLKRFWRTMEERARR